MLGFIRLHIVILALIAAASAQTSPPKGIKVEQLASYSTAPEAGMLVGDVLLSWSRGDQRGEFIDPFDMVSLQVDQAPLGTVVLRGRRGSHEMTWTVREGSWGITAGPILPDGARTGYEQALADVTAGQAESAARRLRVEGDRAELTPNQSAWILWRAARGFADARLWTDVDETCGTALDRAANMSTKVLLLRGWASLLHQGDKPDEALRRLEQALALERAERTESLSIAESLLRAGEVAMRFERVKDALKYLQEVLRIRERLAPGSLAVAETLDRLGSVIRRTGDAQEAIAYHLRALKITESLAPGGLQQSSTLQNLGTAEMYVDDYENAFAHMSRALEMRRKLLPGSAEVASVLGNLGMLQEARGDLQGAERYLRESLALFERTRPGTFEMARSMNNLGMVLIDRGDVAAGERYFREVLELQRKIAPDSLSIALALNNLGAAAHDRRDLGRAEEYYGQALSIHERLAPDSMVTVGMKLNLADIAVQRGEYAVAERVLKEALDIQRKRSPFSAQAAEILQGLGVLDRKRGNLEAAQKQLEESLAMQEKLAPRSMAVASVLFEMGEVAEERGDLKRAEDLNRRALETRKTFAPGSRYEAESLYALSRIARKAGGITASAQYLDQALSALERQTERLGGTEETRARFSASHAAYYRDYMDVLLELHRPEDAFAVLERSRTRSLLRMIAERDLVFAQDLPEDLRMKRRENAASYDRAQEELGALDPANDAEKLKQAAARLQNLAAERARITEQIKQLSPRLAALQYPKPLGVAEARSALDPGTLLLSYSVHPDRTVVFALSQQGPLGQTVIPAGEKQLRADVNQFRSLIERRNGAAGDALKQEARRLYTLLLEPFEPLLEACQRILVVPDGPLHFLPFAALAQGDRYLVERKPVHTAVSLTVYAELKRSPQAKERSTVVAFGDAHYPGTMTGTGTREESQPEDITERGRSFSALPFSRMEVAGITSLFPQSLAYVGSEATEESAKSIRGPLRYLHFATHGVLDSRFPLNSALVLSIPEQPKEGEDNGFLQAWEIFEDVQWEADLVVLSACQTGLGEELAGEGLMGLTRALQYAGARSVLASLWSVDDRRTAELMRVFYTHLKRGAPKDEALRAAQLAMIRSRTATLPFYWAAFSLNGDWR